MSKRLHLSADEMRLRRNVRAQEHRRSHPELYRVRELARYVKDRDKRLAGHKRWRTKNVVRAYEISRRVLARIDAIKNANPCMDCQVSFPPECMDFDHRPGVDKIDGVGHLTACRASWARIEAEMAKCDLVCANCHRIRTKMRLLEARIRKAA